MVDSTELTANFPKVVFSVGGLLAFLLACSSRGLQASQSEARGHRSPRSPCHWRPCACGDDERGSHFRDGLDPPQTEQITQARGARSTQLSIRGARRMHQLGKAAPLRSIPAAHQPQTPGDY